MSFRGTPVLLSPNGQRFVVLCARGDLDRNGNWLEILAGRTTSLAEARQSVIVARMLSYCGWDERLGIIAPTQPSWNRAQWLDDNERIVFMWNDGSSPTQVVGLNVLTGKTEQLTRHPTSVLRYSITADGRKIVYVAMPPADEERIARMKREGFAVESSNAFEYLAGNLLGQNRLRQAELYFASADRPEPRKIDLGPYQLRGPWPSAFSPDGRQVLCNLSVKSPPAAWQAYTDRRLKTALTVYGTSQKGDASQVQQLCVVDLERGSVRPLLDAPNRQGTVVWSPDGTRVLIGPTFLPVERAEAAGLAGLAFADVELSTGAYTELPVTAEVARDLRPVAWEKSGVVLGAAGQEYHFKKTGQHWVPQTTTATPGVDQTVGIELRQGMTVPPAIYAVDRASGYDEMIFDLNPELRNSRTLGRVTMTEWRDRAGARWTGRLYFPPDFRSKHRYPLVIQTHGYAPEQEFSTSGQSYIGNVFAAEALANRGYLVLQMQDPQIRVTPEEPASAMAGMEGAVEHFDRLGWIDPARVGLVGFSRSGWYVSFALAHSAKRFGAAVISDSNTGSYLEAVLRGRDHVRAEFELNNGAPSYGEGLKIWLDRAPGFNAHRVHTPLRIEMPSEHYIGAWEMFSNLEQQNKPVELFVVPDAKRAEHPLQNPRQRLASQEGAVDWLDFWLSNLEDPDPRKAGQYVRWRRLRERHVQDLRQAANRGLK